MVLVSGVSSLRLAVEVHLPSPEDIAGHEALGWGDDVVIADDMTRFCVHNRGTLYDDGFSW